MYIHRIVHGHNPGTPENSTTLRPDPVCRRRAGGPAERWGATPRGPGPRAAGEPGHPAPRRAHSASPKPCVLYPEPYNKKVALVRVLLESPDILLLDEPSVRALNPVLRPWTPQQDGPGAGAAISLTRAAAQPACFEEGLLRGSWCHSPYDLCALKVLEYAGTLSGSIMLRSTP